MTKKLLMGNEAFAHAALKAGVRVAAGYPGTPSSELIETISRQVQSGAAHGVHVEWSTNEKAALELLAGASYAGARTLFTCKQVGLNVASDALMSLNYVGVEGGCVIYVADDPGPISSQTEQDTRRFASFAKIPVFDPADVEQGAEMMPAAFDLSERYRTPVIVRPTTRVCHSSAFVDVADETSARAVKGFVKNDDRWVIFPSRAYRGHCEINDRLARIASEFSGKPFGDTPSGLPSVDLSCFNPIENHGELPKLGIVCGGDSCAYSREALLKLSEASVLPSYRFMQVGTPYPFPDALASEFCEGLDSVIVFEELDHVIEDNLNRIMGIRASKGLSVAKICGRASGACKSAGENDTDDIASRLAGFFGIDYVAPLCDSAETLGIELPVRPPVLCAGCPHRGAFYACKQAVRKLHAHAVFSGDIGCYTLGNAKPLDAVDTCLCMGAGITMAQGLGVVSGSVKQLAFIGDSTFFASGMTGVANAVYNQHDITICVLDNSTTAMTGGQPHPGTGKTLMGTESKPLSIERVLEALGVECIEFANPHDLAESTDAAIRAMEFSGPSAVVFRAPCVNLVKPKPAVSILRESCNGCKRCIVSIGCPAIGFGGDAATVDESLCTGCGLCVQVCPSGAILKTKGGNR